MFNVDHLNINNSSLFSKYLLEFLIYMYTIQRYASYIPKKLHLKNVKIISLDNIFLNFQNLPSLSIQDISVIETFILPFNRKPIGSIFYNVLSQTLDLEQNWKNMTLL